MTYLNNLTPYAEVFGCKCFVVEDHETMHLVNPEHDVHGTAEGYCMYMQDSIIMGRWAESFDTVSTHEFIHYLDYKSEWRMGEKYGEEALWRLPNKVRDWLPTYYPEIFLKREAIAFFLENSSFANDCYSQCSSLEEAVQYLDRYLDYYLN